MTQARDPHESAAAATEVDFYVLATSDRGDALRFACRLAEQVWQRGHRVWLRTASADEARAVDELLWTFRQDSFVPHARADASPPGADEPIVVGAGADAPDEADVAINLAEDAPPFASRCRRLAEIVYSGDGVREAGRRRYREYRELGLTLRSHDVSELR